MNTFCGVSDWTRQSYDLTVDRKDDNQVVQPRWAIIATGLMRDRGLTQEDLKEVFSVTTRGAVGHYMRGRREPSIDQLIALASKLGVTLSELVGEIPLTESRADTAQISALLQEIDQDKLPMLLAMIEAAAARK
jgi:transcriptional regulator with XRE-family HTH domain